MIDTEHLKVGNEVYSHHYGSAKITKIGRKYTYTTNRHLVIENSTLKTKHTGYGHSTYSVFKSEAEYNELVKEAKFITSVAYELRFKSLNIEQARLVNDALKLGVEP